MRKTIAVVGATGSQGGGVVDALLVRGMLDVRALTRRPDSPAATALKERGCETVYADLNDPASLRRAFTGCHGVFLMTNAWEPGGAVDEFAQGKRAVEAASDAGVAHLVWSTLPNCHALSGGDLPVRHFTEKARVDDVVRAAGFDAYTFVEAPMYFQNLQSAMSPQPLGDGRVGWAFPMNPDVACIHNGDVNDVGKLVARVFEQPEVVGQGQVLSVTPGAVSWREIVDTLNAHGHDLTYVQVPRDAFAEGGPVAVEIREMMEFWEAYSYFGPDADEKISRAKRLVPEGFTSFTDWVARHMPAGPTPLERYLAAIRSRDRRAIEASLAEEAVLITQHGHIQGRENVGAVMVEAAERLFASDSTTKEVVRSKENGVGYLLKEDTPAGLDMHVVVTQRDQIVAHTVTLRTFPRSFRRALQQHGLSTVDPEDEVTAKTKAVLDRHLSTFGNTEPWLANKTEDVTFITQAGTLHGRDQLRRVFTSAADLAPKGYSQAVETLYRSQVGNIAYLVYRAEPFVSLGMDTWIVEDDKIAVWAYAADPPLPNLSAWLNAAR